MSNLIDTTEMYLKSIYELLEDGVAPLRARIAERLHHSGPTVSQTVARMERDGLLKVARNREIHLTDKGVRIAINVVRKHRLAERLLLDVIGVDWVQVHEEACRWEHVMSDNVESKLLTLLENPNTDPYGNPIPLGNSLLPVGNVKSLRRLVEEKGNVVGLEVLRIGEPLQAETNMLALFKQAEIFPGATVSVESTNDGVILTSATINKAVRISGILAAHFFVKDF